MRRKDARELAMRLVFAMCENGQESAEALLERFREPEYYTALAPEDKLFETFPDEESYAYISRILAGVSEHAPELDSYIESHSVNRSFSRISATALAAMRVAIFEVLYMSSEVPPKAAINAALDLVRLYDSEETVKFVNGILGAFTRTDLPD